MKAIFADLLEQPHIITRPHTANAADNDFQVLKKNREVGCRSEVTIDSRFRIAIFGQCRNQNKMGGFAGEQRKKNENLAFEKQQVPDGWGLYACGGCV